MIAGKDAVRHGEAKNSWLTGTAAWNFVAISQYLLGVRPEYDGLRVQPVHRQGARGVHRSTLPRRALRIPVKNAGGNRRAPRQRQGHRGHLVPYAKAGETVKVECEI